MIRANNIIEQAAAPDNLRLAFWKARKGKAHSKQVEHYQLCLDENLMGLRDGLLAGKVPVGDYRYFKVFDPKEREICASAFREQVVHHALMNICHPVFERYQIFDSYASRPGKGVYAALDRAKLFTRKNGWFLKLDVRKFFASIPHRVLKGQLYRLFKDHRLLSIFRQLIDSYTASPDSGLPIGNLSSQYFANHYLAGLDHFIKEKLHCKAYVRYMDDMVLWHKDKEWLIEAHHSILEYVETRLECELKPMLLNKTEKGVPFCGYLVFPYFVRLNQRSKRRYLKKLKHLDKMYHSGEWDEATCQRRALPLIAFTKHADTLAFRKSALFNLNQPIHTQ